MPDTNMPKTAAEGWNAAIYAMVGIAARSALTITERGKRPLYESFAASALAELADAGRALLITPEKDADPQ